VVGVTVYEWGNHIQGRTPRGWASVACLVLFTSSVQMISLGVIGEYLSRIFLEVKGRPTFLIASIVQQAGLDGSARGSAAELSRGVAP